MHSPRAYWRRTVRFAAAMVATALPLALPSTSLSAAPVAQSPAAEIEVTERDVAASNAKLQMAYGALAQMWRKDFDAIDETFAVPRVARYRGAVRTTCGAMRPNNAFYCLLDNTIYYDEVFVAAQAKAASSQLGTDGDMAGIGVIAHEVGHAVAIQLGHQSRLAYENESTADCLAGAFARQASRDGSLETGDVEEAFFGMAAAGDPQPELTGNSRIDRRIVRRAAVMGHGTREQRTSNFRAGLDHGPGACLTELAGID
jgi:uncharacterized protein